MYEIKKIIDWLANKYTFLDKGVNLFAGRIDEEMLIDNKEIGLMIFNDVMLSTQPYSFGTYNTQYLKDTLRFTFIGNESIYQTTEAVNTIFSELREIKSIDEIGVIQMKVDKPYAEAKIKGNVYKYNMFVEIIYRVK